MTFDPSLTVKHFIFARLNFRESGARSNSRALNFREFETYLVCCYGHLKEMHWPKKPFVQFCLTWAPFWAIMTALKWRQMTLTGFLRDLENLYVLPLFKGIYSRKEMNLMYTLTNFPKRLGKLTCVVALTGNLF